MIEPTGIAIVGCGYIADSYRYCLPFHAGTLRLVGVFDRDPQRRAAYEACWRDKIYDSLARLLEDPSVKIVVNTTDPENHADVTRAAIAAGKCVYSEKPLAMNVGEAMALRDAARAAGVMIASAPCNMLGESAQTAWAAVRAGRVGKVRLIYAELDDGMIHRANYRQWINRSGRAWPARGEFATGCTFEHAGYALTVLGAMFGPVRRVTSFSSLLIPDKRTDPPLPDPAPDFSVGLLEFDDGVVARLTNSIVAPYDHRMRLVGDDGTLEIAEPWDYACPVVLRPVADSRLARLIERRFGAIRGKRLPHARPPLFRGGRGRRARGPAMPPRRGFRRARHRGDGDVAISRTRRTSRGGAIDICSHRADGVGAMTMAETGPVKVDAPLEATILTCSFRGDFENCRMLCESVDRFVPASIEQTLFVPKNDIAMFSELATARRKVVSEDTLLPTWFRKLPLPGPRWRRLLRLPRRNIYLTPFSPPVRGWIAQQMMKIAAASRAPTEIVLHVDSDNVFIRPLTMDRLTRDNRHVRLYQQPNAVDQEGHKTWHLAASRLFGLPPDAFHAGDYIDSLVVWRRSVARKMIKRIESVGGRDWRIILARTPHFSEYILYGVFAERVLGLEEAGLVAEPFSLCHSLWSEGFGDAEEETAFVESLRPEQVMCLVQSTLPLSIPERRRVFDRVREFAARRDSGA